MFKVNNKDARTTPMASFWHLYCELGTYFTPCSTLSIVNIKHVIAGWGSAFRTLQWNLYEKVVNG